MAIAGRGDFPFSSVWPTIPGLTKEQRFGGTDQSLESALNFWFFGIPNLDNDVGLFIHGWDSSTDNLTLFTCGHEFFDNDTLELFVEGFGFESETTTLYISTVETPTEMLDLFIHGKDPITDNITLYIENSVPITTSGNLFIHGHDSFSGSLDLATFGLAPITDSIDLSIHGPILASGDIDFFLKVPEQIVDSSTLYIFGYKESNSTSLFLKTEDNDIATSRPLSIYGSPSGVDLSFTGQEIDLFVKSSIVDSVYPPVITGSGFLFLCAETGVESNSGSWTLFLNSNTSLNNRINLYISTFEKIASETLDLFIARIPDFPSQEGYTPVNSNQTLFLKTQDGAQNNLYLSISGVPGPVNDNITCFTEGFYAINNNLKLILYGITDDINDNITLYLYGIDTPTEERTLFIRGY